MESSIGPSLTTSNTSGQLKVSSHPIVDKKIHLEYDAREICYICGGDVTMYASRRGVADDGPTYAVPVEYKEYKKEYPWDIAYNKVMYHTCSDECVDVFNLTLGSL